MNNPKYLIVHHTGGSDQNPLADTSHHTFEMVNEDHRRKWNFRSSLGKYIGYHYFIDKNGKITQGRSDYDDGAHTIGKNKESIGICLAGNFDATTPTMAQFNALKGLLVQKVLEYSIPTANIVPHRAFALKSCYGNKLPYDWSKNVYSIGMLEAEIQRLLKLLNK